MLLTFNEVHQADKRLLKGIKAKVRRTVKERWLSKTISSI
jgi:hypothetical protein